jgi:RNA polymerase sigma-70 factor (ECF subfamily)
LAPSEIDRSLIRRCLGQEPGAWKDFVDRYLGLFIHVLQHTAHSRSVALSPEDIDDLCAELFLTVLANDFRVLRRFKGQSSLASYLTVIARRLAVREIARRRQAEALGHVRSQAPVDRLPSTLQSPQSRLENQDLVERMMVGLSPTEAEIVRRYHLLGMSYREISDSLGVAENTIGPTLTRAREKLRQELQAAQ